MALVKFGAYPDTLYLLVGVAKDLQLAPRQAAGGYIYTYRVNRSLQVRLQRILILLTVWQLQGFYLQSGPQTTIDLVHKTTLDDVPNALCPFQGKVLVGVGKLLRLYDLGKKKLLRKSENKVHYAQI